MRIVFVSYFFFFFVLISMAFSFCIFDAIGFEEGTLQTQSAQTKYSIIGYITYAIKYLGNTIFDGSKLIHAFFLPLSIIIDALGLSVIAAGIHLLIRKSRRHETLTEKNIQ